MDPALLYIVVALALILADGLQSAAPRGQGASAGERRPSSARAYLARACLRLLCALLVALLYTSGGTVTITLCR
jgi:hypothetical protein